MKSSPSILSGRMCPDFSLPALAGGAGVIADGVEPPPGPMTKAATFADILTSVEEFYQAIEEQISSRSFPRLGKSGLMVAGEFWTLDTLEWPSAAEDCSVCSLTETLETWEDWRERNPGRTPEDWQNYIKNYYLSAKACQGILRRAEKGGRSLPETLQQALSTVAAMEEDTT